uniref:Uncharacterized protein n=1 Tax=Hyaloperonospora arabidopsidis (strain Emoy2) TaxID=559515 RepID=M4BRT8_HYAAE
MEGASGTYVPLQFYNSQKVITGASINGVPATTTKANFLFSANPSFPSKTWYQNVDFSVTSDTGETLNSSLAFDSDSGCATSSVQFYSASTADGVDGNTSTSGSSSSGAIIGAVCGGIAALFLVIGSVIFIRRRKQASKDMDDPENEMENQFLSPAVKPLKAAPSTSYQDDRQTLASPTVDYAESFSPAANSKATNTKPGKMNSPLLMPAATAAVPAPIVAAPVAAKPLVARGQMSAAPASCPPGRATSPSKAAPTTFAFSSNLDSSSRHPSVKTAPTLSAPVVHHQPLRTGFYDDDVVENRSSFDIDDMRETEARATSIDYSNRLDTEPSLAPFSAADPYVNTVTSPQSNRRATSLRRPGSKLNTAKVSGRGDSGRYVNDLAVSNTDSYAPEAPCHTSGSIISNGANVASNTAEPSPLPDASALSARPSYSTDTDTMTDSSVRDSHASRATQQNADLSTSQRSLGSMRESGGYSTDSLNILGYPYSKKSGRHHNSTG